MSCIINKDTRIFASFSESPGNNGCIFFNEAFSRYGINAIYKSFYSVDIENTIKSVKHLDFSGFALSIPLKTKVLDYLDEYDSSVLDIGASNTIINDNGKLYGYNTDWIGVYNFFLNKDIKHVNIIGFGGFGKAISHALSKLNITFSIVLRNDIKNIDDVSNQTFINATPIEIVSNKNNIIDGRPFTEEGKIIARLQAIEQFKLYTGITYENP